MLIFLFFVLLTFREQKTVVCDDSVKIYRHCLFFNVFYVFRGFNDYIPIDDIKDVYIARSKDVFREPILVGVVDWKNMVVIETDSKCYYAPVENSCEFINEINKKRSLIQ